MPSKHSRTIKLPKQKNNIKKNREIVRYNTKFWGLNILERKKNGEGAVLDTYAIFSATAPLVQSKNGGGRQGGKRMTQGPKGERKNCDHLRHFRSKFCIKLKIQ